MTSRTPTWLAGGASATDGVAWSCSSAPDLAAAGLRRPSIILQYNSTTCALGIYFVLNPFVRLSFVAVTQFQATTASSDFSLRTIARIHNTIGL